MPSARQIVNNFIRSGTIPPTQINEALNCTQVSPSLNQWVKFIDRFLLCLGTLSIGISILFFIAYNWNEWGRFAKFALIESLLIVTILLYFYAAKDTLKKQLSLLSACLMVGVLMAYYGQTYQTGADPWTLFFFWALLITPWVIIARFAALWLSWLALLNIALSLYTDSFGLLIPLFDYKNDDIQSTLFLFNSLALCILELSSRRYSYLAARWLARIIASLAGGIITMMMVETIMHAGSVSIVPWLFWGGFIASLYIVYRYLFTDLFMLAGACLSIIIIIVTLCIDNINSDLIEGFFLLIPILIISLTSLATVWLKKIHKEMLS